jgi:hypothetical protein|tara:strand:+ start:20832 stop:21140 length:309 start_codon:yes stop_codon:yes gene_type:complete
MKIQLINNVVVAIVENAIVGDTTTEITNKEVFDVNKHMGQEPNEDGFITLQGIMNNRADITFVDIDESIVTEGMLKASKVSGGLIYENSILSISDKYKKVYK